MSEAEACRVADDTNVWVGVKELQERIELLEAHIRVQDAELARLAEPRETIDRLQRELSEARRELESLDVCWHCNCLLEKPSDLPHCDDCPSCDDGCYEADCDEPGCVELAGCRTEDA